MAIGLDLPTDLTPIEGIELASFSSGIRYQGRDDLVLISLAATATTAAIFTRNRFCAAPVQVAKDHLDKTAPRALVINSGNANAGTGTQGLADAKASCELVGQALGIPAESVLPFSTGVIGEALPMGLVASGIAGAAGGLDIDGWLRAARAIMTTDTQPKAISRTVDILGTKLTMTGMVKGSGMIRPDMATLLAFVALDAEISAELLKELLKAAGNASFSHITVDGDTSTNDACVLMANGRPGALRLGDADSPGYNLVAEAVKDLMIELAQSAIRDAEGVTKFVEICVRGADHDEGCREIAFTVAHSPLVKTALFASDPNWGRILAAVGRAPVEELDISRTGLSINGVSVVKGGNPDPGYSEEQGQLALAAEDIRIDIVVGEGATEFTVWTTDLSHDYVSINADYRS